MDCEKIAIDIKDLGKRKELFNHYLVDLEDKLFTINQLLPITSEGKYKESLIQAKKRTGVEIRILRGQLNI